MFVCVCRLQKSVSEWMLKALQVELQDWQRDQEPDTDHEGFYLTSLPTIITQVGLLQTHLEHLQRHTWTIGRDTPAPCAQTNKQK